MNTKLIIQLDTKYDTLLTKYGVYTPLRKAHFWAQVYHESGGKPIAENLNYSAKGLLNTFGKYFTIEKALLYERQPRLIANKVYANRMGNGDENSGMGWKFRGRGFIQITGYDNYKQLSNDTGIDYVNNPDLLLNEADALISALWFWNKKGLNVIADNDDKDDVLVITKKINGGINGLEDRNDNFEQLKNVFK